MKSPLSRFQQPEGRIVVVFDFNRIDLIPSGNGRSLHVTFFISEPYCLPSLPSIADNAQCTHRSSYSVWWSGCSASSVSFLTQTWQTTCCIPAVSLFLLGLSAGLLTCGASAVVSQLAKTATSEKLESFWRHPGGIPSARSHCWSVLDLPNVSNTGTVQRN